MDRYPELSPFTTAFADAYRGFMAEFRITGKQISAKLNRNLGYVSERVNGKRALDTEDIDALAMLAGDEWTGRTLMIELARRARVTSEGGAEESTVSNVLRFPHTGTREYLDDELAVAQERTDDPNDSDEHFD